MSQESKKQTAVEWLFAHLLPHLDWSKIEDRNRFRQLKKEALEMEKEQKEFCWDIAYLSGGFVGKGLPNHEFPTFEQYYTEVYGKE
jgi:hypothetical protein